MPNASDPFEMDDGFEDIPVVKAPVQNINKVANTTVKATAAQAKAIAKTFVSQLYGSSTPAATDDDQQQADATGVDPMAQAQKTQATGHAAGQAAQAAAAHAGTKGASATQQTTAATPEEEEKLAQARRELAQTHNSEYFVPTFGEIGHLESEVRKEAQKRQQQEQEREQEKEQEKQQLAELEEKKKKEPIAVTRGRNKAESNRGASG